MSKGLDERISYSRICPVDIPTPRFKPSRNAKEVTCGIDVIESTSPKLCDCDMDKENAQSKTAAFFRLLVSHASILKVVIKGILYNKIWWNTINLKNNFVHPRPRNATTFI